MPYSGAFRQELSAALCADIIPGFGMCSDSSLGGQGFQCVILIIFPSCKFFVIDLIYAIVQVAKLFTLVKLSRK